MSADDLTLAVLAAFEAADLAPIPLSQAAAVADALAERFPGFRQTARPRAAWKRWTPEEVERLRVLYVEERLTSTECARLLGRPAGAVKGQISRWQLVQAVQTG